MRDGIRALRTGWGAAALVALATIGGCAGYASWPPVDGERSLVSDPNNPPVPGILIEAMRYMGRQYPPAAGDGRFAINLPDGLLDSTYAFVARHVGGEGGGVEPLTPQNEASLPVYHVERVRVRGTAAQVEVVYPSTMLDRTGDGSAVWQGVRLWMERSVSGWKVTMRREWTPGVVAPPPAHYWNPDGR